MDQMMIDDLNRHRVYMDGKMNEALAALAMAASLNENRDTEDWETDLDELLVKLIEVVDDVIKESRPTWIHNHPYMQAVVKGLLEARQMAIDIQ